MQKLEPQAKGLGVAAEALVTEEIGNAGLFQMRGDGLCPLERSIGDMADQNREPITAQVPCPQFMAVAVEFENLDLLMLERRQQRLAPGRN